MKYLAILWDSFREAIDSKVIYVLVALSLLVTLFMLSMGFKPDSAIKAMQFNIQQFPVLLKMVKLEPAKRNRPGEFQDEMRNQLQVRDVAVVKGEDNSPSSTYRVTVAIIRDNFHPFGEKAVEVEHKEPNQKPVLPEMSAAEVRKRLEMQEQYKIFKIQEVIPVKQKGKNGAGEKLFEVVLEPGEATRRMWPHELSLFFGALPLSGSGTPLGFLLSDLSNTVLWIGSLVTMLVSVIITAFFIPNMLRKGTVDLLIVKPIHRWVLLIYKYIGGLTFVFLNTGVAMLGIWLALGLRSGIWANSFLLMVFIYTFFFAILYAISTLFAVMTRSAIVAMMVTCGAWFFFFIVSMLYFAYTVREKVEAQSHTPGEESWANYPFWIGVRAVHYITPRTSDIDAQGRLLLSHDFKTEAISKDTNLSSEISWGENLTVSLAFIAVMLVLSCWWFSTKDY